ncbi:MAG: TlpA family protein disulfide reductase [Solirubrobacterales bacterium]|nr:TlpA family protein disulfide reductase [Solirubrobacterales bacterium]
MTTFWKALLALLTVGAAISLVVLFMGNRPVGSENLIGKPLPDFSAPLASGTETADANIYTAAQAEQAKSTAACDVEFPDAFNSCRDLTGSSIISFWNTGKQECVQEISTLDDFAAANSDVSVVAVAFDQTEEVVRKFVGDQDWKIPVAIDRDGAAAALYSVAGCPSTYFARDGEITGVKLGVLTAAQLEEGLVGSGGSTN